MIHNKSLIMFNKYFKGKKHYNLILYKINIDIKNIEIKYFN